MENGLQQMGQIRQFFPIPAIMPRIPKRCLIQPILLAMIDFGRRCKAPWGEAVDGLEPAAYSHLMTGIKSYCCRCTCLRAVELAYGDERSMDREDWYFGAYIDHISML